MNIELSLSTNGAITTQRSTEQSNLNNTAENSTNFTINSNELAFPERQATKATVADEQLVKTIERAIKSLQGPETSLEISVHEKTHDIMVKVLNKETGELIREIPPEKTLDLVAKMMEIAGILIDEKI